MTVSYRCTFPRPIRKIHDTSKTHMMCAPWQNQTRQRIVNILINWCIVIILYVYAGHQIRSWCEKVWLVCFLTEYLIVKSTSSIFIWKLFMMVALKYYPQTPNIFQTYFYRIETICQTLYCAPLLHTQKGECINALKKIQRLCETRLILTKFLIQAQTIKQLDQ